MTAVALLVVPVTLIAFGELGERRICGGNERRALERIRHPGGIHPGSAGDYTSGGCIARANVPGAPGDAWAHYVDVLPQLGWRIVVARGPGRQNEIVAERPGLRLRVEAFAHDGGTRVIASVAG